MNIYKIIKKLNSEKKKIKFRKDLKSFKYYILILRWIKMDITLKIIMAMPNILFKIYWF